MKSRPIIVPDFFSEKQLEAQRKVEQIVLGQILIDKEAIYRVGGDFTESLFNEPSHKLIARAIVSMYSSNERIDLLTLTNKIKTNGDLETVGGISKISELTNQVSSTQNLDEHVRILQQHYLARYLIEVSESTKFKVIEGMEDVFDVRENTQLQLEQALKTIIKNKINSVAEIHSELLRESILMTNTSATSGVPSGLKLVDAVTNGWQKSDLIILAGRPAMGKTACAISMVMSPAIDHQIPVGIFSLEMSKEQLVGRMQSILSKINVSKIVKKQLSGAEILALDNACKPLETAPIYIDDTAGISLSELKQKARVLVRDHGVKMIVIDYLQLMRSGIKTPSREQEIGEISRGLKVIAKELNVPVIALSQLSRQVENRPDKKPQLSDLRESGQIEQDADMVIFTYRPEYYEIFDYEINNSVYQTQGLFLLLISKHRNGSLGDIPLKFIHENTHITNHELFMPQNEEKNSYSESSEEKSNSLAPNTSFDWGNDFSNKEDIPNLF
jgi:replicative DNA helicase